MLSVSCALFWELPSRKQHIQIRHSEGNFMQDYVQRCGQCSFPSENKTKYTWKPGPRRVPLRGQLLTQCQNRPPQDARLLDKLWDTRAWVSGTELQIQVAPAPLHIPRLRASTAPCGLVLCRTLAPLHLGASVLAFPGPWAPEGCLFMLRSQRHGPLLRPLPDHPSLSSPLVTRCPWACLCAPEHWML